MLTTLKADTHIDPAVHARLDTRIPPYVRILNGSLDDDPNSPGGLVLLGRVDPATFRFLKLDDSNYQRVQGARDDIWAAIKEGKVPPTIDIGVRGQDFISDGADYIIRSPAYIIDGGGRVGTAQRILDEIPELGIRLFAMVHFNTTASWEGQRFDALNKNIRKVSSSLHLRNMRDKNMAVLTLYGLSQNTPTFPLYKRVCWNDNMQRGDLLRATVLAKLSVVLHAHQTKQSSPNIDGLAISLKRAAETISLENFRHNIATFFSVINECWPFDTIEYRHAATQLKSSFLIETARMFCNHPVFWDDGGKVLNIFADDRRKFGKFPINDPTISNLAGSAGKARHMLYKLLIDHMNSGRRTQRLVPRSETQSAA